MVAENHVTLCKHRELATMHREILLALGQIWIVAHQYTTKYKYSNVFLTIVYSIDVIEKESLLVE